MKRNFQMNVCGRLYHIDEDAYDLLKHYLDTLHNYFRRQEGGDEIASDIEERVAELLDEIKGSGTVAITIDHIQDIIKRVGEVKDIAPEGEDESTQANEGTADKDGTGPEENTKKQSGSRFGTTISQWLDSLHGKRLYRDTRNKWMSGVLSGFANYLGGNVYIWRLVFIILLFLGVNIHFNHFFFGIYVTPSLIITYILLAIIVPEATTPEDRLKMRGEKVNPQTLANEVSVYAQDASGDSQAASARSAQGCLSRFFCIIGKTSMLLIVLGGIFLFIPFIVLFFLSIAAISAPDLILVDTTLIDLYNAAPVDLYILDACVLIALFIPAYSSLHYLMNMANKVSPMNLYQRITWTLIWIGSIALIVAESAMLAKSAKDLEDARMKAWTNEAEIDHDYEFFKQEGWKLLRADNLSDQRYTYSGQYYDGDESVRYLDAAQSDADSTLVYQAERTEEVEPGTYTLTAIARCSQLGEGVFVYAYSEEQDGVGVRAPKDVTVFKRLNEVPARGAMTDEWKENDRLKSNGSIFKMNHGLNANESNRYLPYGWTVMTIGDIKITHRQIIHYGVSTDQAFTGKRCTANWFSASDFVLHKL